MEKDLKGTLHFVIVDSNGRYNGEIDIDGIETGGWAYAYDSQKFPTSWVCDKNACKGKLLRLQEANKLSEFDIEWEIIELTGEQLHQSSMAKFEHDNLMGYPSPLCGINNLSTEYKPIKKGCARKHKKMIKEIYGDYRYL